MIITCPKCSTKYQLKEGSTATRVRCKKCQAVIQIQPSAGAPPKTQHPEMKTVTPEKPSAQQRSEMKTAVPSADAAKADAKGRSELKTQAPSRSLAILSEESRSEMQTSATPAPSVPKTVPTGEALIGRTLGGYEVLKKLGEGGMGAVYEARQVALDRSVALKVLPAHLAASKQFITRFSREALAVAKLNHSNVVQIYDIGKEQGTYFFSMEYVRGTNLGAMIEEQGKMEPSVAVGYILQAARGMEYAHRKNIIHRDIKPDNIMVNEEGVAKVADLGLAKQLESEEVSVTMSGVGMGTPVYMSPEQGSDAKNVDARADVYSLGCTLYHMLTGRIPFEGTTAFEIITKHVSEPVVAPREIDPDVPEEISDVVTKMLAKKKEDRYQSMTEVIAALEEYLGVKYGATGFEPTEPQINALQEEAGKIAALQRGIVGRLPGLVVAAVVVLGGVVAVAKGSAPGVIGVSVFGIVALLSYVFLIGVTQKTYLYRRVRQYIFGNKISDWITGLVVLLVIAGLVWLLGGLGGAIVGSILGLIIGVGCFYGLKRPLLKKRAAALESVKKLTRDIRRKGVPDEAINVFICRHGGKCAELICEELSGYDAVLTAREARSQEEREREKRSLGTTAREMFISWLNRSEEKRAKARRRPKAAPAPVPADAEKTSVMPASAEAVAEPQMTAAEEAYIAEVIEEKKPGMGALLAGIPKFLLGGKGRVTVGALMLLLSGLSVKGVVLENHAVLTNPNFMLFALALAFTGFVHSKAMLTCFALSCLASGPGAIVVYHQGVAPLQKKLFSIAAKESLEIQVDVISTIAAGLFILAFIVGILLRGKKQPPTP